MSALKGNIIWSGLGFFTNKGGLMLSILIASHFLQEKEYVHYSLFLIAVNVFSGIMSGSLTLMANRYSHKKTAVIGVWVTIQILAFISSVLYLIYGLFSFENTTVTIVESLYIFGNTYLFSVNGIYYGQGKFKQYARINMLFGCSMILISGLLILFSNYLLFISSLTVPLIVYNFWSSRHFRKQYPWLFSVSYIKRGLMRVFLPSLISGILFQPAILISAELLLVYSTDTDLITYSVANQVRMILMSLSVIIGSVVIKQLVTSKDRVKSNLVNIKVSFYPIIMVASGIVLFTELIFSLFGQMERDQFTLNLLIIAAIVVVASMNSAIGRNFVVDEKGRMGVYNNLTWLIVYVLGSVMLIPFAGSIGANLAFLGASLLQFFIWLPYSIRNNYLKLSFFNMNFWIVLSLFSVLIVTKLAHMHLLLSAAIFVLLCFWVAVRIFKLKLQPST